MIAQERIVGRTVVVAKARSFSQELQCKCSADGDVWSMLQVGDEIPRKQSVMLLPLDVSDLVK